MKLFLNHTDRSFRWFQKGNVSVRGYLFDENEKLYQNEELANYFDKISSEVELEQKLKKANGFFSVVIQYEKMVFIAVDHIRSLPLFYAQHQQELYISDSAYWINDQIASGRLHIDEVSKAEFMLTGYVTGNDTLLTSIKQVQAGEYLVFDENTGKMHTGDYFKFVYKTDLKRTEEHWFEEITQVHDHVFNRLIESLNGRTVVVPLSGGLDSRIIVQMLKKLGYEKVICFSYGQPGNIEAQLSKEIADYLGYPWIFVPYTKEKWKEWYNSEERFKYFRFASQYASLPHVQDWPAVLEMKSQQLIPEDAIFIPGHAYDFLQGGHIPEIIMEKDNVTYEELENLIYKKHFSLYPQSSLNMEMRDRISDKLRKQIGPLHSMDREIASNRFEWWDWRERQAKFIANSIRVYDYFGYEWRLPLWDIQLVNLWLKIPLQVRFKRKLYYRYVNEKQALPIPGTETPVIIESRNTLKHKIKKNPILNKPLKRIRDFYKMTKSYDQHPLGWFWIVDYPTYLKMVVKGADNINSILVTFFMLEDLPKFESNQRGYNNNG